MVNGFPMFNGMLEMDAIGDFFDLDGEHVWFIFGPDDDGRTPFQTARMIERIVEES
jgi:hypothetical protein